SHRAAAREGLRRNAGIRDFEWPAAVVKRIDLKRSGSSAALDDAAGSVENGAADRCPGGAINKDEGRPVAVDGGGQVQPVVSVEANGGLSVQHGIVDFGLVAGTRLSGVGVSALVDPSRNGRSVHDTRID